jgi:carbon-monoxide dehydrogenase medium subunit
MAALGTEAGQMQVPAPFDYERATSVDDAIGRLARLGESARLIAGGHSLLPMMKLRLVNVEYLIDINPLHRELGYITVEPDRIRVGALTRHRQLLESTDLLAAFPIVRDAERVIADPVVRNRGTIGGALCQADPSEDLSAVCATLDATCVIRGPRGERVLSMGEFYRGPYETAVEHGEMLTEIRLPIRPGGSSAYFKVGRRVGDWPSVSCGAAVWLEDGLISDARVGLAAVGPNTIAIEAVSAALRGRAPSEEVFGAAGALAAGACRPVTDQRGSAEFKRHLAGELTVRALRTACERVGAAVRS